MRIDCTKENPWKGTENNGIRVIHHDTVEVGEQEDGYPGGDLITIKCINCGKRWKEELPQ